MPLRPAVAAFALAALLVLVGCEPSAAARSITGRAVVVDGDGVEIDGKKIRLHGIDAPEIGQYCKRADATRWRCGQYATVELDRLVGGRELACEVLDEDRYGRPVALCRLGDVDVAESMVRGGWALAYRRYSEKYVDAEDAARAQRAGIWRGTFEKPWDWRARAR